MQQYETWSSGTYLFALRNKTSNRPTKTLCNSLQMKLPEQLSKVWRHQFRHFFENGPGTFRPNAGAVPRLGDPLDKDSFTLRQMVQQLSTATLKCKIDYKNADNSSSVRPFFFFFFLSLLYDNTSEISYTVTRKLG